MALKEVLAPAQLAEVEAAVAAAVVAAGTADLSAAHTAPYTPATAGDWPAQPTTIADALDKLAARLNVLEP